MSSSHAWYIVHSSISACGNMYSCTGVVAASDGGLGGPCSVYVCACVLMLINVYVP